MDQVVRMLEKYASNLEGIVAERTQKLNDEKRKTEQLLHRMLPPSIADKLKAGLAIEAEYFNEVTVYFSDIVDFTVLCADSTPMQVVRMLNDLYSLCDAIISDFKVYKVDFLNHFS